MLIHTHLQLSVSRLKTYWRHERQLVIRVSTGLMRELMAGSGEEKSPPR